MFVSLKDIVGKALRKAADLHGDGIGADDCWAAIVRLDKIILPTDDGFADIDVEDRVIALLTDTITMVREGTHRTFLADELEEMVSEINKILHEEVEV